MMSARALGSVGRHRTVWVEVVHHGLAPKVRRSDAPSSRPLLVQRIAGVQAISKTGDVLGRVPMKALQSAGDNFLGLRRDRPGTRLFSGSSLKVDENPSLGRSRCE